VGIVLLSVCIKDRPGPIHRLSLFYHAVDNLSNEAEQLKGVRAHCYWALLLRTQIHTPRHSSSARASNKMNNDREDGHCYSFVDLTILDIR